MAIKGEWINYRDQIGYYAVPDKAQNPLPSVIVIAEVTGVNPQIEDVTRRIASAGYAALAPDFYAVNGKRPDAMTFERIGKAFNFMRTLPPAAWGDAAKRDAELAKLPEKERTGISETFASMSSGMTDPGKYIGPLKAAVRHLRHENEASKDQKVGCVGFCMGGGLSSLLACEDEEVSGAAVYYGNAPAEEKIKNINCPVIGFYGETDERVNAGIPAFEAAMKKYNKSFEYHIYKGAGHAFFNDDNPSYNADASRDSFARLLAFFSKTLIGKDTAK